MIHESIEAFSGEHCETTATGTLLRHIGVDLSEPMLFGLGEGLSYIYWHSKSMAFPFIGGRVKPDILTENICRHLGLQLTVRETSSVKKAWEQVEGLLARNEPVGLKLDCYHLDYFTTKNHFAGHYVAMYGYDDENAFLVDTQQQGGRVKTSLESLRRARAERGPMSSRNLSYSISGPVKDVDWGKLVQTAVHANSEAYLNPPISNIAYKGILKTSKELRKWFERSDDVGRDFQTTAMLMERAGTGGALFRNFYRDFLAEAGEVTGQEYYAEASEQFGEAAESWSEVARQLDLAGKTANSQHIERASKILKDTSVLEKVIMERLHERTS